ncbi:unnamed protein product, partial [Polarella glacialis]
QVNRVAGPLGVQLSAAGPPVIGPNLLALPLQRDKSKLAFTLENVISAEECSQLVAAAEAEGFAAAGLGRAGEQVASRELRDSARLISEDPLLAAALFQRIRLYLPVVWQGRRLLGLNEQLKFLRYHPGQKFVAHFDGEVCRPGTKNRTCLTAQLYLSADQVEGGSTRFVGGLGESGLPCLPLQGRVLVFQHNILHEGEEVRQGVKYTLRTDVEYGPETLGARLQEMLGLGGSLFEQRRLLLLSTLLAATAVALGHIRSRKVL